MLFEDNACAADYTVTQLTNNNRRDSIPRIDSGQVVWAGYDGNDWEIFLYNGNRTTQITNNNYDDFGPQISNGQLVWSTWDGNDDEIFFYDGNRTIQLTNNDYDDFDSRIDNGKIVWVGYDGFDEEIFLYDGNRTIQLTNNDYRDWLPQINNGQIVWTGGDPLTGYEIFFYDGNRTIQLTNNAYFASDPQISNGQVVWSDWDNFGADDQEIFFYDGNRTIQLTNNDYDDLFPCIDNGQVAWYGGNSFNDDEIFFYDGNHATQLTNNNYGDCFPQIHNGQVAWNGGNANDEEVFFYDGDQITRLTDNHYEDRNPQISNGQIVWSGGRVWDGDNCNSDGEEIFIATIMGNIEPEIIDGSSFSNGAEIFSDFEILVSGGDSVDGAVTDGVTRLLIRMPVGNNIDTVTLSLVGSDNPDENGMLYNVLSNNFDRGQGQSIQVLPVAISNKKYIFAGYIVPENFVREGVEEDRHSLERRVTLTIQSEDLSINLSQEIRLIRPPLILVHGLWSGPKMWDEFKIMLENEIPDIRIFTVNYKDTNASHLSINKDVLADEIVNIKGQLQREGIAMVQADVLGHSMGGILGRMRAGGGQWAESKPYNQAINFMRGDINKLITLDSPHFGSFMADFAIGFVNSLDPIVRARLYERLGRKGFPLDQGAIEDLQTMSPPVVYLNSIQTNPASHSIIGDFVVNVDLSLMPNEMGVFFEILKRYRFNTAPDIIPGESDLVVDIQSQAGGLSNSASSMFNHHHMAATTQDAVDKVIELLNAKTDSGLFEVGFPINQWP